MARLNALCGIAVLDGTNLLKMKTMTDTLHDSLGIVGELGLCLQCRVDGHRARTEPWVSWLYERCGDTRVVGV